MSKAQPQARSLYSFSSLGDHCGRQSRGYIRTVREASKHLPTSINGVEDRVERQEEWKYEQGEVDCCPPLLITEQLGIPVYAFHGGERDP